MKNILLFVLFLSFVSVFGQTEDEAKIKSIYDEALAKGKSYSMLEYLTTKIGARLSGSDGAAKAVEWTKNEMKNFADSVWLQPVMVPHWVRGKKEVARIVNVKGKYSNAKKGSIDVNVCALGMSVGTGPKGVQAGLIEVKNFDELRALGEEKVKGKIVFFNRPMDPTKIQTFQAYGGAVDQRAAGASEAAKLGAIGVVVRSMGSTLEDYPHTGGLRYAPNVAKIPAIAIATRHAEMLSQILKEEKDVQFFFQSNCETLPDAPSFNVIGELRGSEFPDEYIVVGGHLDSWDLAQGAHDDGAGCVQSMEVLRVLKAIGYKPKRTIRAVMFMNEENGLRGGQEYAKQAELKKEKHLAAIESDRGGFTPRGFSMASTDTVKAKVRNWKSLLEPYGLTDFTQSGGGADIGPLANQGVALFGYLPDSQRYFSYHHTPEDTFDKVNQRELELGAASMAALVYLIDTYGLK
jgi:carboxypeptidase Q